MAIRFLSGLAEDYVNMPLERYSFKSQRFLDLFLSAFCLCIFAPLILVIYLWVRLEYKHPIFVQQRVGRGGTLFWLYKFRTIDPVAPDNVGSHEIDPGSIGRIGSILRKTRLDEFPQLLNVVRGDMSMVGPRPCLPSQIKVIEARRERGLTSITPGITGLAQLAGADMSDPFGLASKDAKLAAELDLFLYFKI